MLSPSPPVTARVVPIPTPLPQGRANIEHPMLMRIWRELGLVASLARTDVGSIIIQYSGPGPLSAPSYSPTDHRLTVLHASNRAETASAIVPSQRLDVSA